MARHRPSAGPRAACRGGRSARAHRSSLARWRAGLMLAPHDRSCRRPFGPAGNGLVVMSQRRRHLHRRPGTGATVAIVTGPETDRDPLWSQDGTMMLLPSAQSPTQPGADLLDGRPGQRVGLKPLTPEPVTGLTSGSVLDLRAEAPLRAVARWPQRRADLDRQGHPGPVRRRRPTGAAITQLEHRRHPVELRVRSDRSARSCSSARKASMRLTRPVPHRRGCGRTSAPSSSRRWMPRSTAGSPGRPTAAGSPTLGSNLGSSGPTVVAWPIDDLRIHVMAADERATSRSARRTDPGGRRRPPGPPTATAFSSSAASERHTGAVIVDVDGNEGSTWCRRFGRLNDWFAAWSPDGTTILATPGDSNGNGLQQELWDARTGEAKPAPWNAASYPSWQRTGLPERSPGGGPPPSPGTRRQTRLMRGVGRVAPAAATAGYPPG